MKRLALLAVAALFASAAPAAHAQWRDHDGGRGGREGPAGDGRYGARDGGGPPRGGDPRGYGGYGGPRGPGGYGYGGGYGYAPEPSAAPRQAWRRGQVLPPDYRGAAMADPGRYHLRAAPNGYGWVGDGRNAYLMQRSTGMVLDSVPGVYDPPQAPRSRRRRR